MAQGVASTKLKAKRPDKPVYFVIEKLVRPSTGEEVGAMVPLTQWDVRAMRDRKYRTGMQLRAMLTNTRNYKFLKLAHAIGALAADHVEGFEAMETHDALKRLQSESGICCQETTIDASPVIAAVLAAAESILGPGAAKMLAAVLPDLNTIKVKTPLSIAFDTMDESEFSKLVHGICQYLREKYHGVPPGELSDIIAAVEEGA